MAEQSYRWKVTGVQETTQPGAVGQITRGVRVLYQMADNTTGSVFVSALDYKKPDVVRAMIEEDVRSHEAVKQLRG